MIELSGIAWDHTRGFDPMVATAQAYERVHPDVKIVWQKRSLHDFGHAPVDKLAEQYDLVVLDHPWVGFIADTKCYLPLDEWISHDELNRLATNAVGPSQASYEWDGHTWSLAIDAATPSASYRPDLLERLDAPVPVTWDEVVALGRRCLEMKLRIALPLGPVDAMTAFLSLASNLGADLFASRREVVDRQIAHRVLTALDDVIDLSPADVFSLTPISLMDRMSTPDEIAYCPHAYSYSNYARPGYRRHVCRYANMPALGTQGPRGSHIGGTGLSVSSKCQHPRVAVDYAARVAGAAWQRTIYFEAGGQPAQAAAWDDPGVNAACSDFFFSTRETIDRAYLRPRYNGYLMFQYDGGDLLTQHLQQRGDRDELIDRLNALYQRTLARQS
jgi:multiple sugar transport system substrate-binding protein